MVTTIASAIVSVVGVVTAQAPAAVDPWGAVSNAATKASPGFLSATGNVVVNSRINWWHPFDKALIPLSDWVTSALSWIVIHFRPFFQAIRIPVDHTLSGIQVALQAVPQPVMLLIIFLLAWSINGRKLAIGAVFSFVMIGLIGVWSDAMITLSLVLTSLVFCLLLGLPLGILCARSDRFQRVMRPVLDGMQTTPAFVYLVPVVMLFGIGNVPGVVVTIIFALAPLIRLTNLGIRQVRPDLIEASRSFGASPWQLLVKVQLPLAMPTIMAGVNQALMLSLSMVVIASMIAVGGLGQMVLRGIGRLDMGLATVGGLGIVLMAIVLDRMTQSIGQKRDDA
ncbi:MAG: proline/glycine betaine ABC transporter permease ProW [Candidimonas sp.]|nr:MAG: proline/glycine betaine ABC transporter permease ProW [Candidimonas sp.]TAM18712.1 MAG: proline/glycine betaine ABC transporter permease ProW [Candidimonas sp.]